MSYRILLAMSGIRITMLVMIGTDHTASYKSNHNTIPTTTSPNIQWYISTSFIFLFRIYTSFRKRQKREPFSSLFRSEFYIERHCTYIKSPNQLTNCLNIAETGVVLNVFKGVICDVGAYTVTVSFCCSTGIRYQKSYVLVSDRI